MRFDKNVELDARMVLAAMKGGIDGYMNAAFLRTNNFSNTNAAMERAKWLKKQNPKYLKEVTNRVIELEKL